MNFQKQEEHKQISSICFVKLKVNKPIVSDRIKNAVMILTLPDVEEHNIARIDKIVQWTWLNKIRPIMRRLF